MLSALSLPPEMLKSAGDAHGFAMSISGGPGSSEPAQGALGVIPGSGDAQDLPEMLKLLV